MLELYHGTTSVCAQKVRLVLAEKDLPWTGHLMTLRGDQYDPAYLKLNPNAVVPTLVHDGNVIIESTVIIHYLDEAFPEPALMPSAPLERARARLFMKLVDEYIHNSCFILSFATANRPPLAAMSREARYNAVSKGPDAKRAAAKIDLAENGLDSPYVADAVRYHEKLLSSIEEAMAHGPYLAGAAYSLADVAVTPYVQRLDRLRLAAMWDKRPGVAAWYERIRARPSFETAVVKLMSQSDYDRFAGFQPEPWPKVRALVEA